MIGLSRNVSDRVTVGLDDRMTCRSDSRRIGRVFIWENHAFYPMQNSIPRLTILTIPDFPSAATQRGSPSHTDLDASLFRIAYDIAARDMHTIIHI